VLYASSARTAPFGEVYGQTGVIDDDQADRRFTRIYSTRPLRLLALDDGKTRISYDRLLDSRICSERPYVRTQAWSQAFHGWISDLDGLRYTPRVATGHSYALYLDRCADALAIRPEGVLRDLVDLLLEAADAYQLHSPLAERIARGR
jgi:hypothetical protein